MQKLCLVRFASCVYVTTDVVALVFLRCWLEGLSFQLSVALISGLKGGAVVGVAIIVIFAIGEPRRKPPGGRR